MSIEVKKETYVNADEKTARALTYDMFSALFEKLDEVKTCHNDHMKSCDARFKDLENRKKKDRAIAATSGFGGGFIAVIITWIKGIF